MRCSVLCDSTFLHGIQHLEILPGGRNKKPATASEKSAKKPNPKKASEVTATSEQMEFDDFDVVVRPLNINDLSKLQYGLQPVNDMGTMLEICLSQFIVSELFSRLFEREQSPFICLVAMVCTVLCLHHLLQTARFPMSLDGRIHANQGSLVLSFVAFLSMGMFLATVLLPSGILDVNMDDVAKGVMQGLQSLGHFLEIAKNLIREFLKLWNGEQATFTPAQIIEGITRAFNYVASDTEEEPPIILKLVCITTTSIFSGILSALLLLPAQRLSQCMASALYPPPPLVSAAQGDSIMPIQASGYVQILFFAAEASKALSLLLWIVPVAEGLLGFNSEQRAMAQGIALLCVGTLHLFSLRHLLQGYLSTALERWYLTKHKHAKQRTRKNTALITTSLINNTSAMLPRVSQQLLAPACIYLALGCIICDAVGLGKGELSEDETVTLYHAARFFVPPSLCSHTVARTAGFLGLFSQTVYGMFVLFLRRNGVLKATNV